MMDRDFRIKLALLRKPSRVVAQNALRQPTQDEIRNMEIIRSRKLRQHVTPIQAQPTRQINPVALFTGGIGDIFAVESYFSDQERNNLTTVLYGTNKQKFIQPLLESLPNYPNLKTHKIVWDDFRNFWCFLYKKEIINRLGNISPPELIGCEDWGILPKFEQIKAGIIKYNGSSFLNYKLADVTNFNLNLPYAVLTPFSTDKRNGNRDFTSQDWAKVIDWVARRDMKAVVINQGEDQLPSHSRIIDLSNKTTATEAIEILKGAKAYVGIDTWLSVLAAKLFDSPMLAIKSNNRHCYDNKHIYFAPKKKFDFLGDDFGKLLI